MSGQAGIYVSIPFCRAKCTFCNFASGVFAGYTKREYVDAVCAEIAGARAAAQRMGAELPAAVDSVYFGGGTPSLLEPEMFREIFARLRGEFALDRAAEITVECAPGQLSEPTLDELLRQGMNRLSFGVQSFVDGECAAVGRTHTRDGCLAELARVKAAGVSRVSLDLIAGLPGQSEASWRYSVDEAIACGVEHVSVYMFEVDEDSTLGREALGLGMRYGAARLPQEDAVADWYGWACERLESAGVMQYEISNFARPGGASRHNLKYWQRDPYVGFGLDAHSMLRAGAEAVRWANACEMPAYLARERSPAVERVEADGCLEEAMFLGLRLNRGVDLEALQAEFGAARIAAIDEGLGDVEEAGLVRRDGAHVSLTARGRVASNEVFGRLLLEPVG
jgi:oxygen-independent coproporphyrinogen-3 oxidase